MAVVAFGAMAQMAPTFMVSAGDQVTVEGGSASFVVLATGAPAPSYRWQMSMDGGVSWTDIANSSLYRGVSSSLLVLSGVPSALSGRMYRAIAANSMGSHASAAGTLTVFTAPVITSHPADRVAGVGQTVTFLTAASGRPHPSYRWQVLRPGSSSWVSLSNGGPYAGATSGMLTVSGVTPELSGSRYRVVVSNGVAAVTSDSATLTVDVTWIAWLKRHALLGSG